MFEFSYSCDSNYNREWDLCGIEPTDVKIYYEDKKPYIDYTGEAIGPTGMKVTVHIPKIGLSFNKFHCKEKNNWRSGFILDVKLEAFATPSENVLFTITECEMTKDQIDAMVGCTVKIVGEK